MRILPTLLLLLNALAVTGSERGPAVPDYPAQKVADRVWVIHGPLTTPNPDNQGFMNNPGIIVTNKGAVIIDPGASVQSGEMVLRAAEKLSSQPVVAVFNTHIHGDHWLGNQAIRARYPDARIYAHPNMIELVRQGEGQAWVDLMEKLTAGKTAGTGVTAPDQAINHGDDIKVGNTTFRVHHYGKAHTSSDIMIEAVEPGVVFLGDNVLDGRVPRLDDGDIVGNIRTCDEIIKTSASVFVPGHGKTGDKGVVENMRLYLSTIYSTVERLYESGKSDFEMKDEIRALLQNYSNWISFDEQLGKHVSFAYLKVEEENF